MVLEKNKNKVHSNHIMCEYYHVWTAVTLVFTITNTTAVSIDSGWPRLRSWLSSPYITVHFSVVTLLYKTMHQTKSSQIKSFQFNLYRNLNDKKIVASQRFILWGKDPTTGVSNSSPRGFHLSLLQLTWMQLVGHS